MVALKYHQIYNHNLNKLMEWTTEIIEQPAATCTFRTEAPARCIRGQRPDSFPTVKLKGYEGTERPVIMVSCVDNHNRNHPYELVGKRCREGVCRLRFNEKWEAQLESVGILATKDEDILDLALSRREKIRVDPFGQGRDNVETYDLQSFRLCFQVFIPKEGQPGQYIALEPVVSEAIKAKNVPNRMEINELSNNISPLKGGENIITYCSNIDQNDLEVRFVHFNQMGQREDLKNGVITHFFQDSGIASLSIVFQTPEFYDQLSFGRIKCFVYLYRPSTGETSAYWPFYYEASYPTMNLKMSSAKARSSPYSRSKSKSGTTKDVEKLIRDLNKVSLHGQSDEGLKFSDLIIAASPGAIQEAFAHMNINTHKDEQPIKKTDQYKEESETLKDSLDRGDESFEVLKQGPSDAKPSWRKLVALNQL